MVAATSRTEAIKSATKLGEAAADGLPGVAVFALVDADQLRTDDPDYAITWPVAMVENLLLDAEALWQLLIPHREQTEFRGAEQIASELRAIALGLQDDEVRLRVGSATKLVRAELETTGAILVSDAVAQAKRRVLDQLDKMWDAEAICQDLQRAREQVERILAEGRELESFRGKQILKVFYDRHLKNIFPGYQSFVYMLAQQVRLGARLQWLVGAPVHRIQQYVPSDLVGLLEAACSTLEQGPEWAIANEALAQARKARRAWEWTEADSAADVEPLALDVDPSRLREQLVQTARAMRNRGHVDLERRLLAAAVQIGVG